MEREWTAPATKVNKMQVGLADVMKSRVGAGIRAGRPLTPRPRAPLVAWAKPRTGPPDAEDGRGRSSVR